MTKYKFKGYTITNCGYHQPDHCVWWEAVDENGEACFHGNTLRDVMIMIVEDEWEQKMKKKDEEIEKLKASAVGNAVAYHEALWDILDVVNGVHHEEFTPRSVRDSIEKIVFDADNAPARNCDVGTVKEQSERFENFCQSNMQLYRDMFGHDDEGRLDGWDCRKDCPVSRMIDDSKAVADHCQLAWAQMPYKNEESDAPISC